MVKTAKAFKFAIWLATLVALVTFVMGLAEAKKGGQKPKKETCINDTKFDLPIPMGVSGGNEHDFSDLYCCSGTLGALVKDDSGNYYILSNNHVLASTSKTDPSENIIQPGLVDTEPYSCIVTYPNIVGSLTKWVDLYFCLDPPYCNSYEPNHVDAAIAAIIPGNVDTSGKINCIGNISPAPAETYFRMRVQKSGRTSGLTKGFIAAVDAKIKVSYDEECGVEPQPPKIAVFENQIRIRGRRGLFSKQGDSGSLVVTTGRCPQPVGLLFAGGGPYTFANPIEMVLGQLETEIGGRLHIVGAHCEKTGATEAMGPSGKALGLAKAKKVKKRHQDALLRVHGVVGVGVGVSKTGVAPRIEVYVVKDTPKIRRELPSNLEGIPVRIVETGVIHAL